MGIFFLVTVEAKCKNFKHTLDHLLKFSTRPLGVKNTNETVDCVKCSKLDGYVRILKSALKERADDIEFVGKRVNYVGSEFRQNLKNALPVGTYV